MVGYAQSGQCRWRRLLESFDEPPAFERCGHCDNCRRIAEHEAAQASAATGEGAGAMEAAQQETALRLPAGTPVRVNRYGRGTVVASDWDSVTVSFDGRERSFHRDFVQVVSRARGAAPHR
jgi:ATP-dependent DNA helicase RecQ